MSFQILSTLWGPEFIQTFKAGTVKSLAFPDNKKALEGATWNIFTDDASVYLLDKVLEEALPDTKIVYRDLSVIRDRIDYLHSAIIWQIKECMSKNERLLLATPDAIFGDKTVANLFKLGRDPGTAVLVPHPRVLPSILTETYESNESLVKAAFKHPHRSWSEAEEGFGRQNTFIGGVCWTRLDEKTVSVKHLLPTAYLVDFRPEDLDFFERSIGFGNYDHVWPGTLAGGRLRYAGSSDACFICEITESDKNLPPIVRGADTNQFWMNHPHNVFSSQIRCIYRSE